ncbi:kinase-like domain-containing protein [Tuber indicum]|nr:kinase-like domain-containing protein [Tuber indicum]
MSSTESGTPTPRFLIKQGAEALVYCTTYLVPEIPALRKHRPTKQYRHPALDARLTKHRCLSESRLLIRARSIGIPVPVVYFVDESRGEIFMEWISGNCIREVLDEALAQEGGEVGVKKMMLKVGAVVGSLHKAHIVHGDLTTSNIMVRNGEHEGVVGFGDREVVLIDFGLGALSTLDEDKAVDLYVLERAFTSTHPKAEKLFHDVLRSYEESYEGADGVLRRLQDVRLRGRKRSIIG